MLKERKCVNINNNTWPNKGEIEFKNVSLRYNEKQSLILKNISFKINANEKIGIVGRSGSGKSSIFSSILQLLDIESGDILIDNCSL